MLEQLASKVAAKAVDSESDVSKFTAIHHVEAKPNELMAYKVSNGMMLAFTVCCYRALILCKNSLQLFCHNNISIICLPNTWTGQ